MIFYVHGISGSNFMISTFLAIENVLLKSLKRNIITYVPWEFTIVRYIFAENLGGEIAAFICK